MHCAETLIKDECRVKTEKEKVRVALGNCDYLGSALKEGEQPGKRQKSRKKDVDGAGDKEGR